MVAANDGFCLWCINGRQCRLSMFGHVQALLYHSIIAAVVLLIAANDGFYLCSSMGMTVVWCCSGPASCERPVLETSAVARKSGGQAGRAGFCCVSAVYRASRPEVPRCEARGAGGGAARPQRRRLVQSLFFFFLVNYNSPVFFLSCRATKKLTDQDLRDEWLVDFSSGGRSMC